jgi:hypothetical protein
MVRAIEGSRNNVMGRAVIQRVQILEIIANTTPVWLRIVPLSITITRSVSPKPMSVGIRRVHGLFGVAIITNELRS